MATTFPRFPELAGELRNQIWREAFQTATANRKIPVVIHHHPVRIHHYCMEDDLDNKSEFCGQHAYCSAPNDNAHKAHTILGAMFDGYFCLPSELSKQEFDNGNILLQNLSLACRESYNSYLSEFPEKMMIYSERWRPDQAPQSRQCRQLRCNTARDTLQVKDVPSYCSHQRHPNSSHSNREDIFHEAIREWFPKRPDSFPELRHLISNFRSVQLDFLVMEINPISSRRPFPAPDDDNDFQRFLIFFERLEYLTVLYQTKIGSLDSTAVEYKRVENVDDFAIDRNRDLVNSYGNCEEAYQDFAEGQLATDRVDCCWVPAPKGIRGKWIFKNLADPAEVFPATAVW